MKNVLSIVFAFLFSTNALFAQTYSNLIDDKDFETLLIFDLKNSTHEDARVIGVDELHYNYAAFAIDWKGLGYIYLPARETEIEARFRDIFDDSLFAATYKRDIEAQFANLNKPVKWSFIVNYPHINWTHKTKRGQATIYYTMPIVTSDRKYVILAKKFNHNDPESPRVGEYLLKLYERRDREWQAIPVASITTSLKP